MKFSIVIVLMFSSLAFAEKISFSNRVRFFEKENFSAISTSPLCGFMDIIVDTEIPQNNLVVQKIFEQQVSCNEYIGKIQVFYHQRQDEKYFSQQVILTSGTEEVAFCSSYFSLDSKFLIPGACVGKFDKKAIGLSLFK